MAKVQQNEPGESKRSNGEIDDLMKDVKDSGLSDRVGNVLEEDYEDSSEEKKEEVTDSRPKVKVNLDAEDFKNFFENNKSDIRETLKVLDGTLGFTVRPLTSSDYLRGDITYMEISEGTSQEEFVSIMYDYFVRSLVSVQYYEDGKIKKEFGVSQIAGSGLKKNSIAYFESIKNNLGDTFSLGVMSDVIVAYSNFYERNEATGVSDEKKS